MMFLLTCDNKNIIHSFIHFGLFISSRMICMIDLPLLAVMNKNRNVMLIIPVIPLGLLF